MNFGKNILKLFIILYLHYEELNDNINKEIKSNSNEKYFLINGEFIKKYKEHYNYQQIINKLQNDENVKSVFSQNKKHILDCVKNKKNYETNISLIVQQFKDEFIFELGNKRKNQNELKHNLVNNNSIKFKKAQTTSRLILVYFDGQEMVNSEFIELFKKIEDEQIIQLLIAQEITCLLGEKKVFINIVYSQYFYIDVGHFINNILESDLLVYFYKSQNIDEFIFKIKAMSFDKFLLPHLKNLQEKNSSFIADDNGINFGKILKLKELSKNYYDLKKI